MPKKGLAKINPANVKPTKHSRLFSAHLEKTCVDLDPEKMAALGYPDATLSFKDSFQAVEYATLWDYCYSYCILIIYKAVCHASLRLFVVDTNLFISGKCIGDIVNEATYVRGLASGSYLTVNLIRTCCTISCRNVDRTFLPFLLQDKQIELVKSAKYFGICFDCNLSWS